jgi:hypothetical protein
MARTYAITREDIYRYKREFKKGTTRARLRFAAGVIVVGLAMLTLQIVALWSFQSWRF